MSLGHKNKRKAEIDQDAMSSVEEEILHCPKRRSPRENNNQVSDRLPEFDSFRDEKEDETTQSHKINQTDALTQAHMAPLHTLEHSFELRSIRDITESFPHGALSVLREPRCERGKQYLKNRAKNKPSAPPSAITNAAKTRLAISLAPVEKEAQYWDVCYQRVLDNDLFQSKLQALKKSYSFFPMDASDLMAGDVYEDMLEHTISVPRADVPIFTSSHESELLKEGGRFYVPSVDKIIDFPLCKNGVFCVAHLHWGKIGGLKHPIILMSAMSPEDYSALIEEGEEIVPAPCILCYRHVASSLLIGHRYSRMEGHATPLMQSIVDERRPYHLDSQSIQAFRNICDAPGGYHSEYMLSSQIGDCLTQPIVTTNLSLLQATQDEETQRWWIDQSRLVVGTLFELPEKMPGERVQSFLQRSKPINTGGDGFMDRKRIDSDAAFVAKATLSLLRTMPSLWLKCDIPTLDLLALERASHDTDLHPNLSLACAQTLDALHPLADHKNETGEWDKAEWSSVCTVTLLSPALCMHAHNMAWFSPLAAVSSPILHIMTKCCVIARCQSRTFSEIVRKKLIQRRLARLSGKRRQKSAEYEGYVFHICKQVVLFALLGNYPRAQAHTRPDMETRIALNEWFTKPRYDRMVISFFHHCTSLLAFAFRTYMIFIFDHAPALEQHLKDLIGLEAYRHHTERAMSVVRTLFVRMFNEKRSSLHSLLAKVPERECHLGHLWSCGRRSCVMPCTSKLKVNSGKNNSKMMVGNHAYKIHTQDCQADALSGWSFQVQPIHQAINVELSVFESAIKDLSFRRPQMQLADLLRAQRRDFPLIVLPNSTMSDHVSEKIEEEEEMDLIDDFGVERTVKLVKISEEETDNKHHFAKGFPTPFITSDNLEALRLVVQYSGPVGHGTPVQRLLDFLPCFGISEKMTQYTKNLFTSYQRQAKPTQTTQRAIWILRSIDPYLYNLLQIMSELTQQCQRRMRIIELPRNITEAQMKAVHDSHTPQREGVDTSKFLIESQTVFVYCRVCLHIYSQIRDFNSVYKNQYLAGLRDASVSYLTGKCYCARKKSNHRGQCGQEELARIPLLGRLLYFHLKRIMICPQRGCGNLMAFDAHGEQYMMWNELGPACIDCTRSLRPRSEKWEQLNSYYRDRSLTSTFHCSYCPTNYSLIKRPLFSFLYADHLLCRDHHTPALMKNTRALCATFPLCDIQGRFDAVSTYINERNPKPRYEAHRLLWPALKRVFHQKMMQEMLALSEWHESHKTPLSSRILKESKVIMNRLKSLCSNVNELKTIEPDELHSYEHVIRVEKESLALLEQRFVLWQTERDEMKKNRKAFLLSRDTHVVGNARNEHKRQEKKIRNAMNKYKITLPVRVSLKK